MFFRKKGKKDAATVAAEIKSSLGAEADKADTKAEVEGTAPEIVEVSDTNAEASLSAEETVDAGVVAPTGQALASAGDTIRLFPGFERDDFEVGFRADRDAPSLVMRWKDGGEWFAVPALFNRAMLAAMDERDSASDLNRLLRNYGYDVEAIAE